MLKKSNNKGRQNIPLCVAPLNHGHLVPSRRVKKVLITGGSGFIGRYFIERLSAVQVTILDLIEPQFQSHALYVKGDVRNVADVQEAMKDADTVIHLAAMHHDFGILDDEYFDTNVRGAAVVAAEAARRGITRIINFSSVAVYGQAGNPGPTTENTIPDPVSPYGKSKLQAEKVFENWVNEKSGCKLVTVRSTVVFGPWNLANVLSLIRIIHKGLYVQIGPGNNIKSLAYAGNIADAALFALEKSTEPYCLINYADEPHLSSREIAEMQAGMLNRKINIRLPLRWGILLARPFDLLIALTGKNLSISTSRVRKLQTQTYHSGAKIRAMGFRPKTSIREGMQQMINWYLSAFKKH